MALLDLMYSTNHTKRAHLWYRYWCRRCIKWYNICTYHWIRYVVCYGNKSTTEQNIFWMKLIGSIMLFSFGIYMFRTDPRKCLRPSMKKRGTLLHNFTTALLVTLSNPLIIFLFIALFNMLTFVIPGNLFGQCVGYLSIVAGAMIWWLGLTYIINKMKSSFGLRGIMRLNRSIGVIVLIASFIYAGMTLANLSLY